MTPKARLLSFHQQNGNQNCDRVSRVFTGLTVGASRVFTASHVGASRVFTGLRPTLSFPEEGIRYTFQRENCRGVQI